MATAAAIEDAITCCICFYVYRDPYALPCLHTLCKPCIDGLELRGKVECPECRETTQVKNIRKDFKIQSLIDAHNGKSGGSGGGGSGFREVCGMCRNPDKGISSHCKECEHFMCVDCEQAHKVMKVCRGHTVRKVKDIVQIAQSKLEDCVEQWKVEELQISTKSREIETSIKSIKVEAQMQIEVTNKHFDKLILNLENKRFALVNEIRKTNDISVQSLRKNKEFYDQLSREIYSKIDVVQEVINRKDATTMYNMADDMDGSLKEQVKQIRKQIESLDDQGILPVKRSVDDKFYNINRSVKQEGMLQHDMGIEHKSLMLYKSYLKLITHQYQLDRSQNCNAEIHRICIIQNNIWCAAYTAGIQVYDKNMQLILKLVHNNCSYVTGLAEWHGDIIVACGAAGWGLHQITQTGVYVQEITDGKFSDVSTNGKYVYGLSYGRIQKVVIFTYGKNKWTQKGEIPLKSGKKRGLWDKLSANANSLFISIWNENCIQMYSLEGELQQTFGRGGTMTEGLKSPVISGVDVDQNLLVSDVENTQLKVYSTKQKTWQVVPVKLNKKPYDAVMDENHIWVVTGDFISKILKFTKL